MRLEPPILRVPDWLASLAEPLPCIPTRADRMRFVIELSRRNVEHRTGGPFGAAVFESESGQMVAAGVNLVLSANCSVLHAEMVALILAQVRLDSYDLSQPELPRYELVSSTDPCVMCLGGVLWSGIERLICGACEEDATAVGFDEGPKPADWPGELCRRGIVVVRGVLRQEAAAVLRDYVESGGEVYNAAPNPEA